MKIVEWGLIDFSTAWLQQKEIVENIIGRNEDDTLVLCEHPAVITLGRTTENNSVRVPLELLAAQNISVVDIDRGGEATVHNPGQLVGYPIFDLQRTKPDLHWFLRTVEQCIIDALADFGLAAGRVEGLTGVWIGQDRKICAIGVHCRKWVISHGFALNVDNDIGLFNSIIPCGIQDRGVTSMSKELGHPVNMADVGAAVSKHFKRHFESALQPAVL